MAAVAIRRPRSRSPRAEAEPVSPYVYQDVTAQVEGAAVAGPQPGPQTEFLSTAADICIYGGAAGGGKTRGLLMEATRWVHVAGYAGMIFRRNSVQVRNPGGLWDDSMRVYPASGGTPRRQDMTWTWPATDENGAPGYAVVKFGHLDHETTVLDHGGAAYPFIGFDELTLFTRGQFFFMLSRNRSTTGIRPYIRATCNPDADSWVAEFIAWWIDQNTGYAIPSRSGVLRWMVRIGDEIKWADTKEELEALYGADCMPLSVTFIRSMLSDNPALTSADPTYRAKLRALPIVEQERLLMGNWKIRPAAGLYFQRAWCTVIQPHEVPKDVTWVRGWDLASTKKTQKNDPDWTAGVKLGRTRDGRYYIGHSVRDRVDPNGVEDLLKKTAAADTKSVKIGVPQDPGQAGKFQVAYLARLLDGFTITSTPETGDKIVRFSPFSAQAKAGNVYIVEGEWNDAYLSVLEAFPESAHDDDVDATSRAFQMFHSGNDGIIEYYRRLADQQQAQAKAAANPSQVDPTVWMIAPEGVSLVYGMSGARYTVRADRKVAVQPADVAPLSRSGFTRAPTEEGT